MRTTDHKELVDKVALAVHDLNPVVPRVAGQDGTTEEVADRGPHARGGQLPGSEGRDGPAGGAGRDREKLVGVAGVEDQEEDPVRLDPACTSRGGRENPDSVDSAGDHPMHAALRRRRQLARERPDPAPPVELLRQPQTFCSLRG